MLHAVRNAHSISLRVNYCSTHCKLSSDFPLSNSGSLEAQIHSISLSLRVKKHFGNFDHVGHQGRYSRLAVACKAKGNGGKSKSKSYTSISRETLSDPLNGMHPLFTNAQTYNSTATTRAPFSSSSKGSLSENFQSNATRKSSSNDPLLAKFSEMKRKVDLLDLGPDASEKIKLPFVSESSNFDVFRSGENNAKKLNSVAKIVAMSGSNYGKNADTDADASDDEFDFDEVKEPSWLQLSRQRQIETQNFKGGNGLEECKMLAAVDMGTNSFHMVVVKADSQGRFQIEDVQKDDVRLGSGSSGFSVITPEAEERALASIRRLKKIAETRNAVMRVVATSAVREARNRRMFVRRVYETTGVEVEVLSGREEACLIYMGILQALPVYNKTVLTVDIGGGSTEFVVGRAGKPLFATSLKLGHIRLTERFISDQSLKNSQIDDMRNYIRVMLADSGVLEVVRNSAFELAIGSSGTIETLEQMIHCTKYASTGANFESGVGSKSSGFKDEEFTLEELNAIVKKICKAKTVEMRTKLPGLPEKRADVIVGGAILLEEIFLAIGIKKMKVSPYALREGVIVDTLAKTCDAYCPTPNLRRSSVLNLAKRFNTEKRLDSALHSAELAKKMLSGLLSCKRGFPGCVSGIANLMNDIDFEILEAATILHYIGMFISHKGYHKHSHYLIKNNEHLLGFSPLEIEAIALLAKYHRKKFPSSKDPEISKLPEDMQKKLRALCAVVRIAVALDRCDSGSIANLTLVQDYDSCAIVVTPAVDAVSGKFRDVSLEVWAARSELEYFEKVFKKSSSIIVGDNVDVECLDIEPSHILSS